MTNYDEEQIRKFVKDGFIPEEALALGQSLIEYLQKAEGNFKCIVEVNISPTGYNTCDMSIETPTGSLIGLTLFNEGWMVKDVVFAQYWSTR